MVLRLSTKFGMSGCFSEGARPWPRPPPHRYTEERELVAPTHGLPLFLLLFFFFFFLFCHHVKVLVFPAFEAPPSWSAALTSGTERWPSSCPSPAACQSCPGSSKLSCLLKGAEAWEIEEPHLCPSPVSVSHTQWTDICFDFFE